MGNICDYKKGPIQQCKRAEINKEKIVAGKDTLQDTIIDDSMYRRKARSHQPPTQDSTTPTQVHKNMDMIIPLNEDISDFRLHNKRMLGQDIVHSLDNPSKPRPVDAADDPLQNISMLSTG